VVPREDYIRKIEAGFRSNPLVILTGARQVGKTTLLEMFMEGRKCLWLNGQNPEIAGLFENFSTLERYLKININADIKGWLSIDEFQYIDRISLALKLLTDQYKELKILCSGSSSLDILQKVEESLAGRVRLIPVYPLNFREYLKFTDAVLEEKFGHCTQGDDINLLFPQIRVLLEEYLIYGGLPKVAQVADHGEKEELLNDILQTYLLKDVRQFVKSRDFVGFNKMLRMLAAQTGNMVNVNELSNLVRLPYKTCEEYVHLLDQMFIIHLVPPFFQNKSKEISRMNKVYFCDAGLRNVIYNSFNDIHIRTDNGQLFENYIYTELLQYYKKSQIFYYRTKDGTEIDFIIAGKNQDVIPVEVKFRQIQKPSKTRAITEFSKATSVSKAYIINRSLNQSIENQHFMQPYLTGEL
jgi:predicted AAA+ superfamily ATPase